jgi:hypothetical protein
MWLNSTHIVVGEYTEVALHGCSSLQEQDPENRAIIEQNADVIRNLTDPKTGQKIQLIRIPLPSNCPIVMPCYNQTGVPCCDTDPSKFKDCAGTCFAGTDTAGPDIRWFKDGSCDQTSGNRQINFNCAAW